ncbi:hypothetical protein D9613_002486 [Agrocybe pediades]|uniref:Uncharacterized protein n=1 Tax=Agrocybe pediades TaxID=84607 RepID=A0A8H4QPW9_9AGAR|nr:hypothetical protein D9613_002486 [Agrocybe pediades]
MDVRQLLQDLPILQLVSKRRENFDVWDRIASLVLKETQCVLSLVSKSLTGVMQRHIFRHLSLVVDHDAYDSEWDSDSDSDDHQMELYNRCDIRQRETIQRLIGIVSSGLTSQVRTFKVLGMVPYLRQFSQRWMELVEHDSDVLAAHELLTRAQLQAAVIPVFLATLGQYTGLQTLWLEKIELGLSTHAAFASLHNLVNLRMDGIILLAPFAPSIQFRLKNLLELGDGKSQHSTWLKLNEWCLIKLGSNA